MEVETKRTGKKKEEESKMGFNSINEDIVEKILTKLPALALASAACVCKSWHLSSNRILSRPKLASAISLNPSLDVAIQEVVDKVLSEPIRPHFAIAHGVGDIFPLQKTSITLAGKLGSRTPLIVTSASGIMGRDAVTNKFKEVMGGDDNSDDGQAAADDKNGHSNFNSGFLLTVGYVPGLKVDVVPLRSVKQAFEGGLMVDQFVKEIISYTASVSNCTSPVGIIMFGSENIDLKPVIEKLDYAMSKETIIVGDQKTKLLFRSKKELRNPYVDGAALVLAKDREKPHGIGEIQFHAALSKGVSAAGPRYKAASVRAVASDCTTWLTARREGEQEILDGQRILDGINDELVNRVGCFDLFIGVTERRKCCIWKEKPRLMSSLAFHGITGGDEEYLFVQGTGIKTADYFQVYHSDPSAALASVRKVSTELGKLRLDWNSKKSLDPSETSIDCKTECIGGFIFSCCGRGESFFECSNVDSSPFLENFAEVPFAGIFCGGEIGRGFSVSNAQEEQEVSSCLHVYSSVYLVLSYTPAKISEC
ncbi:F-box/LRR-repeat protein At5g63520 [Mercurialis annua]|uniref:F-box/LRR-repeat protein At5g63520 n=1 Tax=Mercurialis annua TaxID=3986 RepID=UPI00215E7DF1|nr:F-box/LRR-repeat protein At5g63520 [Mercurialis annua]